MIIIADDLTGANDTAIQYHNSGISTIVGIRPQLDITTDRFAEYEVIAANTDSRSMSVHDAYETVYRITKSYHELRQSDTIYKKVDSVLRGNPGAELAAAMDAIGCKLAFVAPAYPENNRIVQDGILHAGDDSFAAVGLFSEQMNHKVEGVPHTRVAMDLDHLTDYLLHRIRQGGEVFVFDSSTDEDLSRIYQATKRIAAQKILCGSAGLARFVGKDIASNQPQTDVVIPHTPNDIVLVVAGTRHSTTRMQISSAARHYREPIIQYDGCCEASFEKTLAEAQRHIGTGSSVIFIAVAGLFRDFTVSQRESSEQYSLARTISANLGRIVRDLYVRYTVKGIILTGGDTALQVAQSLDAYGIEPLFEVAAGVPLGKLIGGRAEGLLVVTKSGGFGSEHAIADSIASILNHSEQEQAQ
ncbi:four-carbon acid sugar kinase family protein [Sediminispirochaeta smaragdinae]|uniref:Type III effector Hrp-dependent outer protein n=1 Tax=Sediminispirochaeta smaragdinae (strain DSM 11293 / JCM 15392 / SEBR 4228) TaxID=573413 RepID=E1R630_SEDSS|nr:four-carbon acid sugar kinase family protein [Sediminispirochaeta smaragdinae]ADK80795.1 type III effector Hrp-dependent outer protein [Sediminispirochaeta smaragdinae DSM 11293]